MSYTAIIYFDGPLTKWPRSKFCLFEDHGNGLRIPIEQDGKIMREPDGREVVQRREFKYEWMARVWVIARLRGFDTEKLVGEVRPL